MPGQCPRRVCVCLRGRICQVQLSMLLCGWFLSPSGTTRVGSVPRPHSCVWIVKGTRTTRFQGMAYSLFMPFQAVPQNRADHAEPPTPTTSLLTRYIDQWCRGATAAARSRSHHEASSTSCRARHIQPAIALEHMSPGFAAVRHPERRRPAAPAGVQGRKICPALA